MIGASYTILAILTIFAVFLTFQAIGGKLFGAKISEVGVFNSPRIFSFDLGGVTFSLNALPLGCYVKFTDDFQHLHPFKKILIVLSGLLSYVVIALIGLSFAETLHQTISGFGQLFSGLFAPIAVGVKYFEALANVLTTNSFTTGLGILASKFLAFNLIPLGSLSGGSLVIYALQLFGIKSEKFSEKFQLIGLLFLLPFYIAYLIAFAVFVWNRLGYN